MTCTLLPHIPTNFTADREPHYNIVNMSSSEMANALTGHVGSQFSDRILVSDGELAAASALAGTGVDNGEDADIVLELPRLLKKVAATVSGHQAGQPAYTRVGDYYIRTNIVDGIVNQSIENTKSSMVTHAGTTTVELGAPPIFTLHGVSLQDTASAAIPDEHTFLT
ncbi:hypothetical protein CMQ_334 [Grosmannia clavigera kw1407]|uniref:Uncharacterized protein n=1 Tax=Grosmannia clavigera (strain kw1407 / UAMH 11150) TaxID=655863 RepID=F0XRI2_GROCL|nr:uncharacterized protein CMQ_334 [Grosmannia clavigera kw1407]EFX00017.1 hypothetical protein CMQ_334 [Grosmannia clavigera kw1407]